MFRGEDVVERGYEEFLIESTIGRHFVFAPGMASDSASFALVPLADKSFDQMPALLDGNGNICSRLHETLLVTMSVGPSVWSWVPFYASD